MIEYINYLIDSIKLLSDSIKTENVSMYSIITKKIHKPDNLFYRIYHTDTYILVNDLLKLIKLE